MKVKRQSKEAMTIRIVAWRLGDWEIGRLGDWGLGVWGLGVWEDAVVVGEVLVLSDNFCVRISEIISGPQNVAVA